MISSNDVIAHLSWHFLSLLPLLDASLSKKGSAITSQDVLAGPPDTYHMTSKKYLTTHWGELTNHPDMDNLDAGTPLKRSQEIAQIADEVHVSI